MPCVSATKYPTVTQIVIFTGMLEKYTSLCTRPVGAYQIASQLRKSGYTVQVIDYFPQIKRVKGITAILKILDKLVSSDTLWIGFSTTFMSGIYVNTQTPHLLSSSESSAIKNFVHSRSPNCRFVIGGSAAFLSNSGELFDTYIEGYGDRSVIGFTKWCEGKNPFLTFKDNGDSISIIHDPKATNFNFIQDNFKWHETDYISPDEVLPIEISRGCIFKCGFCSYPLNGKKKLDYIKESKVLYDELIDNYEKYGVTNYVFLDDTHNDSVEKIEILYHEVFSKLPFKINYSCFLRLDLLAAHPHTIKLLKDSGLKVTFFGIESLNYLSNKSVGKGITTEKIINTLDLIKREWGDNVVTYGSFIIGLPHDSRDTVKEWMKILESDNFKLDYSIVLPLYLDNSMKEYAWAGDFNKNPEKYGYVLSSSDWINNCGMTFSEAQELADFYNAILLEKSKLAGVQWTDFLGILAAGYNWSEARVMSNRLNTDSNLVNEFKERLKIRITKYINSVLS